MATGVVLASPSSAVLVAMLARPVVLRASRLNLTSKCTEMGLIVEVKRVARIVLDRQRRISDHQPTDGRGGLRAETALGLVARATQRRVTCRLYTGRQARLGLRQVVATLPHISQVGEGIGIDMMVVDNYG